MDSENEESPHYIYKGFMEFLGQIFKGLGPARLASMGVVLMLLVGFFVYVSNQASHGGGGDLALLYNEVDPAEGGRIIEKLDSLKVPSQIRNNGTAIYVPRDQVDRLRMVLAEMGLPSGGSIGYEIFDRQDTLGTSSFTQDINLLRALEGELARSIRTFGPVASARVHLVLPRRELFSRQRQDPSASVVLKMRGAARLSRSQVEAIAHLVASAVPGLSPDRISVIDNKGTLLANGEERNSTTVSVKSAEDARTNYEQTLARTIETLLEKSVGAGKVRAEVAADINFDQYTENSEIYDPDGQVIRSTQSAQEASSNTEANQQTVTVTNNLPSATGGGAEGGAKSQSNRTEETINYEISKTTKTHVREVGVVKRLSVAVMVDGHYTGEKEKQTYAPRTPEELEQLTKLVRSAVGYVKDRGDTVEVLNLRFVNDQQEGDADKGSFLGLQREDIVHLAELGVIVVIALLVLLMIIRPLMMRLLEIRREVSQAAAAEAAAVAQVGAVAAAAVDGAAAPGTNSDVDQDQLSAMLSLERVEGRVKASSVKKISEIVEKHPEEAIAIIRSWMTQTSASNH